jgi:hypothetical protein
MLQVAMKGTTHKKMIFKVPEDRHVSLTQRIAC